MSDTILSGDFTVYYLAENRQKLLVWTGSATGTRTTKETYLALQELFHGGTQMDDGSFMTAQTPTEFTVGISDAGDKNPAFIDPESVEHLTGGSLKTASWLRATGTNIGIVRVNVSASTITVGNIGQDITSAAGDAGTMLAIQELGGGDQEIWIRPDTSAAGDDWDSASGTVECNTQTAAQTAASTSGEMQWTNIYNTLGIATLVTDTHQYIYQGTQAGDTAPDALVTSYNASTTWYGDGAVDTLVLVADQSSDLTDRSTFLDEGYISVFARQYAKTYSFVVADLFAGSRTPLAMETGNDLNNNLGYRQFTGSAGTGTFTAGEEFNDDATGLVRGIVTAVANPATSTPTVYYYLIGKAPYSDFTAGDAVTSDGGATANVNGSGPSNYGPATMAGLSVTYGSDNTFDIDQDGTNEYYSIVIDVSDEALGTSGTTPGAFEWTKYLLRRGGTTTANTHGIEAEQFIGIDQRLTYGTLTGTVSTGDVMTQADSGATGTVVAHHTTPKILTLRNTRGTFNDTTAISTAAGSVTASTSTSITRVKANPFGVFAGGKWFLAPGVVINNRVAGDANNYETEDDEGNTQISEPVQVSINIGDSRIGDWITLHRLTAAGGEIETDTYTVDDTGSGHSVGDNIVKVNGNIAVDEPGKTAGGTVIVYDISAGVEHHYAFSSWATDEFTLDQTATGTATGGSTSELTDSGATFTTSVKVGYLIRDTTNSEYAYVTSITSNNTVVTTIKTTTWSGAAYTANDLVQSYATTDTVYVPLMKVYETEGTNATTGSETISIVYDVDIPALLRGRNAVSGGSYNIKPFSLEVTIGSSGLTQNLIRSTETITA